MSSKLRQEVERALKSDLTGYELGKRSAMQPSRIYRLRNGSINLDNLTLKNAEKLASVMEEIDKQQLKG